MNPDEIRSRLDEIAGRLKEIDKEWEGRALPDAVRDEFQKLKGEKDELRRLEAELEARRKVIEEESEREQSREAGFQVSARVGKPKGEEIYDLSTIRSTVTSPEAAVREMRDRAMEAVERGSYPLDSARREDVQGNVERLLNTIDNDGILARRILETGSQVYSRAFGKALEGKPLTDTEARALSTTGSGGGYAIPFTLDPTVIHTSNSSVNPYRSISRVVQVTGNNWHGVTSAGITVSYSEEASEVSETVPTFAQPEATPERATAWVPFSLEIGMDWGGLQAEITSQIQEAKDDVEAVKFTTGAGHGSKEPEGVLTGGTSTLNTAGTAAFAASDVYKVEQELAPRYRPRASWLAKRNAYNAIRQFDTNGGAQLFIDNLRQGIGNNVPTPGNLRAPLLEYAASECSAYPFATTTGGTILTFGDFSRFLIVDRIGVDVEILPVYGENRRPTGQKGFFAVWRNTSKVLDPKAFKTLKAL